MNSSPSDSRPGKTSSASDSVKQTVPPLGSSTTQAHMAATLSHTIPPFSLPPFNHEFRPQLPPLPPPIQPRFQVSAAHSNTGLTSPTSATSSTPSWAQLVHSHPLNRNQPPTLTDVTSPKYPPRLHSTEEPFARQSSPVHGVKRPFDATREARRSPQHASMPASLTNTLPGPTLATPNPSIPFSTYPAATATSPYSVPQSTIPRERFSLHLRQQPRAARAGPDGKDRRTIDPPPVLQVLINDFDPEKDVTYLKAHDWVVHASLVSAQAPHQDVNMARVSGEGSSNKKTTRLLLGTTVSSPLFCSDDPDPDHAPQHPTTSPPPSPTTRFIKTSSKLSKKPDKNPVAHKAYPGAYFIFADLSVRKAGQYRLEFRLMKMEPHLLTPGNSVPTLSVAISDVFNVVNAKDFDQVQPSTNLVKGLLDRGAPFPLKLKKGLREGQRRRNHAGDSDEDGDVEDRDDVANDDNDDNEE